MLTKVKGMSEKDAKAFIGQHLELDCEHTNRECYNEPGCLRTLKPAHPEAACGVQEHSASQGQKGCSGQHGGLHLQLPPPASQVLLRALRKALFLCRRLRCRQRHDL